MMCPTCGTQRDKSEKFCRKCGAALGNASLEPARSAFLDRKDGAQVLSGSRDPDELIGSGLASFFIGDGFFMVGILLSVMESSVRSLIWLLLLIPAFFFFGKGVSDVFQARQIRRRRKQDELNAPPTTETSRNLFPSPSVTERTTRQLK